MSHSALLCVNTIRIVKFYCCSVRVFEFCKVIRVFPCCMLAGKANTSDSANVVTSAVMVDNLAENVYEYPLVVK